MNNPLATEERVALILEQMRKALPEIKRQNEVYRKSLKAGKVNKQAKITVLSRNV